MSSIHILSEKVANQIAAGEVVERPASVVKELVENSLDAAASRIEMHVEGDGTRLLRFIDDGVGMDQDDVLLCLERHATSKLSCEEDLAVIRTLGFRGEAIPSIASVSQLIITSRPKGAVLGSRVEIRHGTVTKVHDMGCAEGTMMEVKNLFGNVPARRKFLKSTRTELAHIEEAVLNCALANSAVAFRLTFDSRMVCDLPSTREPMVRVRAVLGLAVDTELIEVRGSQAGVELVGFLLPPGTTATTGLRLFVNNRPVRDRMLAHAVFEGFQGFLQKGSRPAGVFFVSLPAGEVDVNVHPTKQEVRFCQPAVLHRLVVDTVLTAVECFQERVGKRLLSVERAVASADHSYESVPPAAVVVALAEEASHLGKPGSVPKRKESISFLSAVSAEKKQQCKVFSPDPSATVSAIPGPIQVAPMMPSREKNVSPEAAISQRSLHDDVTPASLKLIGQALNSFILLEDGESLLVIDQHAAQERLLYEKLRQQVLDGGMVRQSLLFPVVLELNAAQEQVVEQFHDDISRMGLELAEFGGSSYRLSAVPALLGHLSPQKLLHEVLEVFSFEGRRGSSGRDYVQQILATMACKAAIKANHQLNEAEMTALVKEMQAARIFSHCPHGRPVVRTFSRQQVGRWFDRT